jgi:curli biogenesis system outer membrane secretion channel CsgG
MTKVLIRTVMLLILATVLPRTVPAQEPLTKEQEESLKRQEKRDREEAKRIAKEAADARKQAESAPAERIRVAPLPRRERPFLSVLDFDYQTVIRQGNYDATSLTAVASALRGADPNALVHEDNQNIGAGLASLVKAELFKGQSFRLVERQKLGAAMDEQDLAGSNRAAPGAAAVAQMRRVSAAQFILTGSITKFGGEDKTIGGIGAVKIPLGIGVRKKKTIVEITAQVIDASTGEVILSVVGRGVSTKGGGIVIGGAGPGVGGIGGGAASDIKETAIGEAMQLAAQDLAARVTNMRDEILAAAQESGLSGTEEPPAAEPPVASPTTSQPSIQERLTRLEGLYRQRLISKVEYEKKRTEILQSMD